MKYLQYDAAGKILCIGVAPDGSGLDHISNVLIDPPEVDFNEDYIQDGAVVRRPQKPSPHHEWDWPTKSWLPNLAAARASKLQEVVTELNARLYLPYSGFDADNVARGRISGTIARLQRGDGLPAGWIGWRDASNQQRWAEDDAMTVLANLTALSRAIEDREQALLTASWQHKANLNALEDFATILSYDTTAGWPS